MLGIVVVEWKDCNWGFHSEDRTNDLEGYNMVVEGFDNRNKETMEDKEMLKDNKDLSNQGLRNVAAVYDGKSITVEVVQSLEWLTVYRGNQRESF